MDVGDQLLAINLDEEFEHPGEVLNCHREISQDADCGCSTVDGASSSVRKPTSTLKVEFGWIHYRKGKFSQVKGMGGGTGKADMERSSSYQDCLFKAIELFYPNSISRYGTLAEMETPYLANFRLHKYKEEGFTVGRFKEIRFKNNLPRIYLVTKPKTDSRPQRNSCSSDTSYAMEVNNIQSSSASEADSGVLEFLSATSSDSNNTCMPQDLWDPDLILSQLTIVNDQSPMEVTESTVEQIRQVGTDWNGTTTAAAGVNTIFQDYSGVAQRHTHPSGSVETNLNETSDGPSVPSGSDLRTVPLHQYGDHYSGVFGSVEEIFPAEGGTEGGYQFRLNLREPLLEDVTHGEAKFGYVGTAKLTRVNDCVFKGKVPGSPDSGPVTVTVWTQTGRYLGKTNFTYIGKEKKTHSVAMDILGDRVDMDKLIFLVAKEKRKELSDGSNQTKQQHSLQVLQLLVYTAAQTGEKQFIEIIFSTSAGQIVFDSYKDRAQLPEDVARANGHDDLANYLQDFTTRFSKEPEFSLKEAHIIDWSELEEVATAAQTQGCLTEENSSDDSSENNSDTDYFADVETSIDSSELSRSTSEDDTSEPYSRGLTEEKNSNDSSDYISDTDYFVDVETSSNDSEPYSGGKEKSQMESHADLPVTYIVRYKQAQAPSESGICRRWMHWKPAMMHPYWTTESTEKASNITMFDRFLRPLRTDLLMSSGSTHDDSNKGKLNICKPVAASCVGNIKINCEKDGTVESVFIDDSTDCKIKGNEAKETKVEADSSKTERRTDAGKSLPAFSVDDSEIRRPSSPTRYLKTLNNESEDLQLRLPAMLKRRRALLEPRSLTRRAILELHETEGKAHVSKAKTSKENFAKCTRDASFSGDWTDSTIKVNIGEETKVQADSSILKEGLPLLL
ncbi:uncharacterized protein [Montipora foliosa]|uniref:uncharacterized protein isoform X2 n=1 Tax=Montipora foliosa TaxID=591990 RepID=UPI0035F14F2C